MVELCPENLRWKIENQMLVHSIAGDIISNIVSIEKWKLLVIFFSKKDFFVYSSTKDICSEIYPVLNNLWKTLPVFFLLTFGFLDHCSSNSFLAFSKKSWTEK